MTCRSRAFSTTATKPAEESTSISNRAAFQSLPVIPSILAHIEKIGVGIRSKPSLSRKRRSNVTTKRSKPSFDDTLNDAEEVEFFANREREHSSSWRDRRAQTVSTALGKKKRGVAQKVKTTTIPETSGSYWLPPPPFSSFSRSNNNITKQSNGQQVLKDLKFTRRPVKCLGKAGSMKDKLPLESKGLSEIAIIGRSNVGKSTVLNALLYGNTDESLSQRRFQRGRTPQGAKLPKGVKATTSHKPGETKELSFYQITADVEINSEDGVTSTADRESESNLNKQLSKMSLLLVDLPGYGFAFAKEERTKEWQELMHHYLLERRSLKRILLLLDARHGFKQTDFEFLGNLQDGLLQKNSTGKSAKRELPPIQIVLTKCDLVKQADLARRAYLVRKQLSDFLIREPSSLPVMLVSALPGLGFNNIRNGKPLGGVLELQRELAALVPVPRVHGKNNT
ncbi:hypothetical protein ACHAXN_001985 [Cyclotella atomus]